MGITPMVSYHSRHHCQYFFSSLYQSRVMDLDRTNRIFYKEVIMDEKRKERYLELDSLIHSDSFFRTYWSLEH